MSQPDIRAAFDQHLNETVGDTHDVAWPNYGYEPTTGTPYLRPSIIPAEPGYAGSGRCGKNRERGVYQIDVNIPESQGRGPAETIAEELRAAFARGTVLTYNGISVRINKAYLSPGGTDEPGWYRIPVTIQYFSDVPN